MESREDLIRKLEKLFDFGFIDEKEKVRLLTVYSQKGLTLELKEDIEKVISQENLVLEKEVTELDAEIAKLEKQKFADVENVFTAISEANREAGEQIKDEFYKVKARQAADLRKFQFEMRALERKLDENEDKITSEIDTYAAQKIRSKLN